MKKEKKGKKNKGRERKRREEKRSEKKRKSMVGEVRTRGRELREQNGNPTEEGDKESRTLPIRRSFT